MYVIAKDGLPARSIGLWSVDKLSLVGRYMGIVSTGMSKKWEGLTHVDLFAGPGLCVVEETGAELPGSPLLALRTKRAFDKVVCVEADAVAHEALQRRVAASERGSTATILLGKCNEVIDDVMASIPQRHLASVFVDPEGVKGLEFSMIQKLADSRHVDFIVLFPQNMAINRNKEKWRTSPRDTPLDRLLGPDWRTHPEPEVRQFMERLKGLGYRVQGSGINFSNSRGFRLYYLLYASRSAVGLEFWDKISESTTLAQMRLF